jgi:hypothetical protein
LLAKGGIEMSIEFSCSACGQQYRVKDEFAGKSTKCVKCKSPVRVPDLRPAALKVSGSSTSGTSAAAPPAIAPPLSKKPAPPSPVGKRCPSCSAALPSGAVLCVQCGYDLVQQKKRTTQIAPIAKRPKRQTSELLLLARGAAVSGLGALLGAVVWAIVAVVTHHEIGWIAWGVGAVAGGGMALGCDNSSDGTIPGIIAAFMALVGITLGKLFVLLWLIGPALGNPAAASLLGGFFQIMFGPMDALFIGLAFLTAYKIGSGMSSD